jgi:transposase-like protein
VQWLVSDDHAGLGAVRAAVFPAVLWQRCQFHLQQNAQAYVPRLDQRAAVAQAVRSIFNSPDAPQRTTAPQGSRRHLCRFGSQARRLDGKNIPQGLAIFALPPAQQRRRRTTNALERVNRELKRRTRVAGLFPNEASLLRRVSALLAEHSDEWKTGKTSACNP